MAHCCVQILKPKQSVSLPIRYVHIKPLPIKTDPTDVLLGLPRGKPRNLVNRKLSTRRHAPQFASESLSRAASDSSNPDRLLGTRAALKASPSTDLLGLRIWWSKDAARASTRRLGFCLLLHAPVNTHTPSMRRNQLLTSHDDVITPRQQPRKLVHVSPSPRQRHIIG